MLRAGRSSDVILRLQCVALCATFRATAMGRLVLWGCSVHCWDKRRRTAVVAVRQGRGKIMAGTPFADRLRDLRHAAGLSQPELAQRAGLTKAGVCNLEQ